MFFLLLLVYTMPTSPFKKLAKDAGGSVLNGAAGGTGVGGEARKSALKKAGWEQGAAKVSRVQSANAAADGSKKDAPASLTDLGVRSLNSQFEGIGNDTSFGRFPPESGVRPGPYKIGNESALTSRELEEQYLDSESGRRILSPLTV